MSTHGRWLLVCSLLLGFGTAYAEQGCPEGFTPNAAGTPGMQCIPIGGLGSSSYQGGANSYDGYGAFAFDAEAMKVGASDSQDLFGSAWQAKRSALKSCKSNGGTACKIIATFKNECAATVLGAADSSGDKVAIYVGKGRGADDAKIDAQQQCEASGSPTCVAAYQDCATRWHD